MKFTHSFSCLARTLSGSPPARLRPRQAKPLKVDINSDNLAETDRLAQAGRKG